MANDCDMLAPQVEETAKGAIMQQYGDLVVVIHEGKWWLECIEHSEFVSEARPVPDLGHGTLQISFREVQEEGLKHVMEHVRGSNAYLG